MSESEPFFTVAIPAYNRLNFLKEAVNSVLSQSYKDFELVIIDDCSQENVWKYLLTLKDSRVRVYRNKKNLGIVKNWKRCIQKGNGKWFKFLMADDLMFKDSLHVLHSLIKRYPYNYVFITSGIDFKDTEEVRRFLNIDNRLIKDTDKYLKPIKEIIKERKKFNQTWAMPNSYTLLTKDLKELIRTDQYKYVENNLGNTGHCVDYYLLYAIAIKHSTVIEMGIPLYGVRCHEKNFSKTYNKDLMYHLNGDRFIHYLLYNYSGIENLYIIRHAFRIYVSKLLSNKRKIISFTTLKRTAQLIAFITMHLFGIQGKVKNQDNG